MSRRPAPAPISWLAAQKRPLIAAHIGGLGLLVAGVVAEGGLPVSTGRLLWPGVLYYVVFIIAFLLPLWLVQTVVFLQMRHSGRPVFVTPTAAEHVEPERRCRFLLSLRMQMFVLAALYLPSGGGGRQWTRPAWLFLALFAAALLGFCLWTIFIPALPPLFLLGAITFWSSALIFGLSHLIRGD
ncbi:MAG: hypothetical protein R3248_14895 [Candidatus Promineifilaceae bacterium]|nr:hypothetical protein [Candidatus Promineifilaceae bacterium]